MSSEKKLSGVRRVCVAVGGVAMLAAGNAMAALDQATHLDPVSTEVSGDLTTLLAWVFPVVGGVLAAEKGIGLFKRFTRKV